MDEASGKYRGGNRDIADAEPEGHGLGEELGIECEVVRVVLEGNRLEDAPRVHAEAGARAPELPVCRPVDCSLPTAPRRTPLAVTHVSGLEWCLATRAARHGGC